MSPLFNIQSRLVIAFLLRSKCLLILAAVTICSDFGAQENSLSLFPLFPYLFAMKWWTRCHDLSVLNVEFFMTNLHSVLKSRDTTLLTFSSSHVQMWELDHKECWAPKNWCFQIVVLEKTLASPLDSKEIKPINLKGNQPWILIGRTDAAAGAPIVRPPDVKNWLIGRDPDDGKHWKQKEKRVAEDEMVWWHHWFNGHELGQTPG